MNKKDAEKKIRELAKQVCVKHEEPNRATMDELYEAGYTANVCPLEYFTGLLVCYPDGSEHYATTVNTTKGRQNRCTIYKMEDVNLFETCTRTLANADLVSKVYMVDCYADNIEADGLRNQIKEGCEQMRRMLAEAKAEEPAHVPGQDDETPLECYEGFTEEPTKAEPMEDPREWLKRSHEGITVSRKNEKACWWVSGNTKPIKDKLKAMGFKWAPKKKMWYLRPVAA